jgi:hypothetical protein
MAFIAVDESARFLASHGLISLSQTTLYYFYPVKTLVVAWILFLYRSQYLELRWSELARLKPTAAILAVGIATCVMWVYTDWVPAGMPSPEGFNPQLFPNPSLRLAMTGFRLAGAVLVVPLMEELFWRSFLLRYLIDADFAAVPIGRFMLPSFLVNVVLFGLEHHFILAGMAAGAIYSVILYKTKSLSQCVLAHAVTNLTLAGYVLYSGKWYFW